MPKATINFLDPFYNGNGGTTITLSTMLVSFDLVDFSTFARDVSSVGIMDERTKRWIAPGAIMSIKEKE